MEARMNRCQLSMRLGNPIYRHTSHNIRMMRINKDCSHNLIMYSTMVNTSKANLILNNHQSKVLVAAVLHPTITISTLSGMTQTLQANSKEAKSRNRQSVQLINQMEPSL